MRAIGSPATYKAGLFPNSHLYEAMKNRDVILPVMDSVTAKVVKAGKGKHPKPEHIELVCTFILPVDVQTATQRFATSKRQLMTATEQTSLMTPKHGSTTTTPTPHHRRSKRTR